jgi:acetyltransferase-like isoleucine patch superfamily enzyme
MRGLVKSLVRGLLFLVVWPRVVSMHVRARLIGRDGAFEDSMQALSTIPGLRGRYIRAAFLQQVLPSCASNVTIEHGTYLSKYQATFGEHAYVGPNCVLGWVHVERDVLIASGVCIPSGAQTHGTDRLDVPIRDQPGQPRPVRIGEGAWIGANSVVMDDVGKGSIVGAGSVVIEPLPDFVFAAGVPARVIKRRESS